MKFARKTGLPFSRLRDEKTGFALVTLLLSGVAAAACGDDAKPCEETQTCIHTSAGEGGEDGGNTGGATTGGTGGMSGRGGSSGGSTGGSAASGGDPGGGGSSGQGTSGDAGAGGMDDEAPTVVSFTPAHGMSDVERDIEVTAELSEAIAPPTVTSASVTLEGPDGEVPGTVTVDDNVITFVPDHALALLATYTFTLDDAITDLAGNPLARSESAEFSVREGAFGAPAHPFGTTVRRVVRAIDSNAFGDVVIGMQTSPAGDRADGAVFNAALRRWTSAFEIGTNAYSVTIDPARRAAAAVATSGFTWSRFTANEEWVDVGALGAYPNLVTSPAGIATSVSRDDGAGEPWSSHTLDLSDGTVEGPLRLPLPDDRASDPFPIASLGDVAVVGIHSLMNYDQELYVLWNRGSGWTPPEPLATGESPGIGNFRFASDEQGNIIVAWIDIDGLWTRIYERENDHWTDPAFVRAVGLQDLVYTPILSAGRAIIASVSSAGTWVDLYEPGAAWTAASAVQLPGAVTGLGIARDSSGNALVVWNAELNFRRYVAGSGWQAASDLDANVDASQMWVVGADDGTAMVVAPDSGTSGSILTVRFE